MREARRQKGLAQGQIPRICILDPDGDLVEHLSVTARTQRHATWACYHTVLDTFVHEGIEYGIIGDFEKGEAAGSATALHVISQTAQLWEGLQRQQFIAA